MAFVKLDSFYGKWQTTFCRSFHNNKNAITFAGMEPDDLKYEGLRNRLVEILVAKGITDTNVLQAIGKVPRHLFFKNGLLQFAYQDNAFPIDANQTISQPYTVAFQTQLLQVNKGVKVLEIGTGSGYQAAVLCALGADVYSIERFKLLHEKAQHILNQLKYKPMLRFGDGNDGWPAKAPFERIIITAASAKIPEKLLLQLSLGGKMVIPFGSEAGQQMLRITRLSENDFKTEKFGNFSFVPMLKGTVK